MKTKWEQKSYGSLPFGAIFLWDKQLCVKTSACLCTAVCMCGCGCGKILSVEKVSMQPTEMVDAECWGN